MVVIVKPLLALHADGAERGLGPLDLGPYTLGLRYDQGIGSIGLAPTHYDLLHQGTVNVSFA